MYNFIISISKHIAVKLILYMFKNGDEHNIKSIAPKTRVSLPPIISIENEQRH